MTSDDFTAALVSGDDGGLYGRLGRAYAWVANIVYDALGGTPFEGQVLESAVKAFEDQVRREETWVKNNAPDVAAQLAGEELIDQWVRSTADVMLEAVPTLKVGVA